MDLTKRQQEIFDFIKRYSSAHGYPPTVRDIGKAVGLASSSTVHAHLANLEKLGLLRRDPSKPRAIELLDRVRGDVGAAVGSAVDNVRDALRSGLPIVGQVAAGSPMLAEENIEDYVQVPSIAGGDQGEYVLRVRGESMKDAGILEGDFVVVRPQETATDGEIVVALVGGGGDRQALLPRGRPRPPAAREHHDAADPLEGRPGAGPSGRRLQERHVNGTLSFDFDTAYARPPPPAGGAGAVERPRALVAPRPSASAAGARSTRFSSARGRACSRTTGHVPGLQLGDGAALRIRARAGRRPLQGLRLDAGVRAAAEHRPPYRPSLSPTLPSRRRAAHRDRCRAC